MGLCQRAGESRELNLASVTEFGVVELFCDSFDPGVVASLSRQLNAYIRLGDTLFPQDVVELGVAGDLHNEFVGLLQTIPEQLDLILIIIDGNDVGFRHLTMNADFSGGALAEAATTSKRGNAPEVTSRCEPLGRSGLCAVGKGGLADQLGKFRITGNF